MSIFEATDFEASNLKASPTKKPKISISAAAAATTTVSGGDGGDNGDPLPSRALSSNGAKNGATRREVTVGGVAIRASTAQPPVTCCNKEFIQEGSCVLDVQSGK